VQGTLAGFDQKSNIVLSDSKERIYSMEEGVEEVPLGLYLVKGDTMYVFLPSFLFLFLFLTSK
jgi:small nuclear ribonucleoprotein (snRNP)-like protein